MGLTTFCSFSFGMGSNGPRQIDPQKLDMPIMAKSAAKLRNSVERPGTISTLVFLRSVAYNFTI